jgi:hypothetical protein
MEWQLAATQVSRWLLSCRLDDYEIVEGRGVIGPYNVEMSRTMRILGPLWLFTAWERG